MLSYVKSKDPILRWLSRREIDGPANLTFGFHADSTCKLSPEGTDRIPKFKLE